MKILISYATNTGNTYLVSQVIKDMISQDRQVSIKPIADTTTEDLDNHDVIILGSSSWDWQGKEGHPLHSMIDFLKQAKDHNLSEKKCAVFGCGDKDFKIFCGAVDHIEKFIKDNGGNLFTDSLKIDKFYVDILRKIDITKAWARDLDSKL